MHIKAVCPRCESTYQVDAGLKGKRMRCPNPICRAVFEVRDPDEAPATPPPPSPAPPVKPTAPVRSGSVGDVVPMLQVEVAKPSQPALLPSPTPVVSEPPAAAFDDFFGDAKPVAIAEPEPALQSAPAFAEWEAAPPVRDVTPDALTNGFTETFPPFDYAEPPKSHKGRFLLATLVVLLAATVSVVVWLVIVSTPDDEAMDLAKAEEAYKKRDFAEAKDLFQSLRIKFPNSEQSDRYALLSELSALRDPVSRTLSDMDEAFGLVSQFNQFLEIHKSSPHIEKYNEDIAESLNKLVEEMAGFAAKHKKKEWLADARTLYLHAKKYKDPPVAQAINIQLAFEQADKQIVAADMRAALLQKLKAYAAAPDLDAIEQAPLLAKKAGLADDPEVRPLLESLPEGHRKSIVFQPEVASDSSSVVVVDWPPTLVVAAFRGQKPPPTEARGRPALALVRGILYAHDATSGTLRWARRVGVDSTVLPLWLPPSAASPALILVGSSHKGGQKGCLLALDAQDGSLIWATNLEEPCIGQPLLVGDRAFVSCRNGDIYEIEIHGGRVLGGYSLGQTVTHGGVSQPGTNLAYFAADRGCIYVLDLAARRCQAILYTSHASGALRCPPVILPMPRGEIADQNKPPPQRAQLLLCVDDGNHATDLLAYALPLSEGPIEVQTLGPKLAGRVGSVPLHNSEEVAIVTDAGALAVFGIKQRHNRDADLFPILREMLPGNDTTTTIGGPAEVVYLDGQNLWVLRGRLHHLQVTQSLKQGWKIVGRPLTVQALGWPLHAGQAIVDDHGGMGLYVVTEAPDGRSCRFSAFDADKSALRWQRQVGLICEGKPAAVDGKVLTWDRSGDLLLFDSTKSLSLAGSNWLKGGRLASASLHDLAGPHWLLPRPDGHEVFVLTLQKPNVRLWKYHDNVIEAVGPAHVLDTAVAGTPALLGDAAIVPLASGRFARVDAGGVTPLDTWRSPDADKNVLAHVIALPGGKVVASTGSQGLKLWRSEGKDLQRVAEAHFQGRVLQVAALSSKGDTLRLCVADTTRTVTLLEGDDLKKIRTWQVSDVVTGGPFVRGNHIGVVVGGRRLIWLDPEQDTPLWRFTFPADIVGEPLLIDGVLIVADESGQIQAIDPTKGQTVGLRFTLEAAVGPAAAPLPYGADRLFVPLTDGSVLLLGRKWYRPTLFGLSIVR